MCCVNLELLHLKEISRFLWNLIAMDVIDQTGQSAELHVDVYFVVDAAAFAVHF